MVLIADNAPYHHKREIGSLGSLPKSKIVDLMEKWDCDHIKMAMTETRADALAEKDVEGVSDLQNECAVEFDPDLFRQTASKKKPFIPNCDELKIGFVQWLRDNKPEALQCKIENLLKKHNHEILWTPPYCPDLQPIEQFWAGGKNHVAAKFENDRSMKQTVADLREGWYGNRHMLSEEEAADPMNVIKPVDCEALVRHSIKMANTRFIPMCPGLSGTIGNLVVTPHDFDLPADQANYPIDMVVMNMANDGSAVDVADLDLGEDNQEGGEV